MIESRTPQLLTFALLIAGASILCLTGAVSAANQQPEGRAEKLQLDEPAEYFTMAPDAPQCVVDAIGACVVSSTNERDRCFEALVPLCSSLPAIESRLCTLEYQACTTRYERRLRSQCPALHFDPC